MVDEQPLAPPQADPWESLLFRQHGVVSRRQALMFLSTKVLRGRVSSERWQLRHRGVYVTHTGPLTARQQLWAAALAVGGTTPALLGGLSALEIHGLRRFTRSVIDVVIPAARRDHDPPAGVRVHRTTVLSEVDIGAGTDPPSIQPPRAVVDAAQWARSDHEARTIIAMSFQQRLVGGDQIHEVLGRMRVVHRRTLIARTAADAREGSETVTELGLVELCRGGGLPIPSRQVYRCDSSGRTRYLDAYFDEWNIRVEVDGAHHMEAEQWWSDMSRHNALSVRGEVLLRFPGWMVRERPAEVVATIRGALLAAGWLPAADRGLRKPD